MLGSSTAGFLSWLDQQVIWISKFNDTIIIIKDAFDGSHIRAIVEESKKRVFMNCKCFPISEGVTLIIPFSWKVLRDALTKRGGGYTKEGCTEESFDEKVREDE